MTKARRTLPPMCPRCGYDLRGAMAAWRDRCPLQGTCPECGLSFSWRDVLIAAHTRPRWCYEFAPSIWRADRIVTTLLTMLAPWVFWRDLTMHNRPRWSRIALLLAFGVAVAYLMLAINNGRAALDDHARKQSRIARQAPQPAGGVPGGGPVPFAPLPSRWKVAAWAALTPFSDTALMPDPASGPLPPNWCLPHSPLFLLKSRYSMGYRWQGALVILKAIAFPALMSGLMAAGFILLPASARRARVRKGHIVRVFLYGLVPAIALLGVAAFIHAEQINAVVIQDSLFGLLCFVLAPLWLVLWWGCAIHRYLRIKHAWGVAAALGFMAWASLLAMGYGAFAVWHWQDVFLRLGFPVW